MDKRVEIELPFCGFYCSLADDRIEEGVRRYFDVEGDGDDHAPDNFYVGFNGYGAIKEAYAKAYVECFKEWLLDLDIDLDLEFAALVSPKEYNFETDRIFATAPIAQLLRLFGSINMDALRQVIKNRFTPRSGFIPFYSCDLGEWLGKPLLEWDANEWGTVVLAAIGDTEVNEWEILECSYGYETVANAISAIIHEWEEGEKAWANNTR